MLHQPSSVGSSLSLSSNRRLLRLLLFFLVLCPLLIYLTHATFGAHASLHRAHCQQEIDAMHTHYRDRIGHNTQKQHDDDGDDDTARGTARTSWEDTHAAKWCVVVFVCVCG